MKTLDDIKAEMPHAFALLEEVQRRIATAKAAHYAGMAVLRERLSPEEFNEVASEKDGRFYRSMQPMNDQVTAILRNIGDVYATYPVPPIIIPNGSVLNADLVTRS